MPFLVGRRVTNLNVASNCWFGFSVLPPERDADPSESLLAYVTCDVETDSFIAEPLAIRFGVTESGDPVQISLRMINPSTLEEHEFAAIPIPAKYASPRLGEEYLQLGLADLDRFFELHRFLSDDDDFMRLSPHESDTNVWKKCPDAVGTRTSMETRW